MLPDPGVDADRIGFAFHEGMRSDRQLISHDPEREQIGTVIEYVVADGFRGDVSHCAESETGRGRFGVEFRQGEIGNFNMMNGGVGIGRDGRGQEDVLRFEIAVRDSRQLEIVQVDGNRGKQIHERQGIVDATDFVEGVAGAVLERQRIRIGIVSHFRQTHQTGEAQVPDHFPFAFNQAAKAFDIGIRFEGDFKRQWCGITVTIDQIDFGRSAGSETMTGGIAEGKCGCFRHRLHRRVRFNGDSQGEGGAFIRLRSDGEVTLVVFRNLFAVDQAEPVTRFLRRIVREEQFFHSLR